MKKIKTLKHQSKIKTIIENIRSKKTKQRILKILKEHRINGKRFL
tara:strand:- start:19760 stop:19894 length:135 start_codon:yes stop_codon:yes gene_type:complete